ncbi:hypothetical protein PB2503_00105 [Parvularcula bermudensis HTCC2503]|uniref:Uncharacterized protein n=1 Tax=Parvularcula bermudensis (strain ATCC BAA-594 / HTCC2503 / KCTC 12087) TaxID=314260 RepID=E0THX9_PARBH|nr:Fur family transcriptional regulator [Parvularcula bermudensis]ADM10790.1 hypothetical protein PB2503_00105 [Parvularcula bermudensis HTCC2503]
MNAHRHPSTTDPTPKLPKNARRVLQILKDAGRPLTAYQVLDELRAFGVTAAPTAYRSLDRLVATGLVHRLETLSAFVACDRAECHGPAAIAVCTECRQTTEMTGDMVPGYLQGWADAEDFAIDTVAIEMLGRCADCRRNHQDP